jgi:hypothetical protein
MLEMLGEPFFAVTELERVEVWRLGQLLDVGYPAELAEQLAGSPDVDLHQALELVRHGCPHETAARILL